MANKGKFVDRNPLMRSAGIILEPNDTVGDSLKNYSQAELAANIMQLKCKKQTEELKETSNLGYSRFLPTDTLKELLTPDLKKSRFVAFREKFAEDMFFAKPELGKVLSAQSKPDEYDNENFVYGDKKPKSESAYELVLPKKTAEEVNREFIRWHDKYIVSHKDYLPSERIKRNYNENFNPKATFGIFGNVDKTGKLVKKSLQECDRLVVISEAQQKFIDRTMGQLGQRINRYGLNLDPMKTFGIATNTSVCNVRNILDDIHPCVNRRKLIAAISNVNKLRRNLFKRADFNMQDLKTQLQIYDEGNTGFITFKSIFNALRSLLIYVSEEKLRIVASHFKIVVDEDQATERVNLEKFWKLLHMQYPLPWTINLNDMPKHVTDKVTTYQLLCNDHDKPLLYDKLLEHLHQPTDADGTRAGDVIAPDIPMHFGLAPSDFEALRTKEFLRRIFKSILTDDNFDKVWEFARIELNGDVDFTISVNDLRAAMNVYNNRM